MSGPRPLPLAPRPWPGEAMRSWLARLAARYDLTVADFLAWLNDDQAVDVWRTQGLDWRGESDLDRRLAIAADLDLGRLEALRVPPTAAAEAERWSRKFVAWCPDCVREDITCHGETYARASWELGFWVTCGVHGGRLADRCGNCGARQCAFGPVHGRLRLICLICGGGWQLADQAPLSPSWRALDGQPGPLGVRGNAAAARLVATMQADLWALLTAQPSRLEGPWSMGMAADLSVVVRELGGAFLRPAWLPAGHPGQLTGLEGDLTTVPVHVAFDGLGLVAAVLSAVFTGGPSGVERVRPGIAGAEVVPVDLTSLICGLSDRALSMVERSAGAWPSAVADMSRRAVAMARGQRGCKFTERPGVRRHDPPASLRARAGRRIARRRRAALARKAGGGAGSFAAPKPRAGIRRAVYRDEQDSLSRSKGFFITI